MTAHPVLLACLALSGAACCALVIAAKVVNQ